MSTKRAAKRRGTQQRSGAGAQRDRAALVSDDATTAAVGEGGSSAFWSYVREDDKATFGSISDLRYDICELYRFSTGSTVSIFMDRLSIGWGQQWRSVIERGINETTFMIPIVTPSYFNSEACRSELLDFNALCKRRGLTDLVLPIVFSGIDLVSPESTDEVARIIAEAQYEDFSEDWPYERGGEVWSLRVLEIVRKLVAAERSIEDQLELLLRDPGLVADGGTHADHDPGDVDDAPDDTPGLAELMADLPAATEEAAAAIGLAVADFESFSRAVQSAPLKPATPTTDPRQFQVQIIKSVEAFRSEAIKFEQSAASALDKTASMNAMVLALHQSLRGMNNKALESRFLEGFGSLGDVRTVAVQMQQILIEMADLERLSSVLRKELRPARRGIKFLRDAAQMVAAWSELAA